MSYNKSQKLMNKSLVQDMVTLLNMFPYKNWISRDLRPAAIIPRPTNSEYNKLKITFWVYAQVYISTINITKKKTVGVIVLRP